MTLPSCLEPENARITIPVVLAVAYAIYHWCHWRIMRRRDEDEDETPSKSTLPPAAPNPRPTTTAASHPVEPIKIPPPSAADLAEAERLWKESLDKRHSEVPDISTDWQYMNLLYKAAMLGHVEAMSRLGDYAYLRMDLVEAFYWKLRVELTGGICRNPSLKDIIDAWVDEGCPDEPENLKMGFGEEESIFAYAVLGYKSGINAQQSSITLNRLAAAGNLDALRFRQGRLSK